MTGKSPSVLEQERNRALAAQRCAAVVDRAHDGIIVIDRSHNIRLFNEAAERIFGYAADEVLGRPLSILMPEAHRKQHQGYVAQFAEAPERERKMESRATIYGLRKDGTEFPAEISISKISVEGETEFTAIVRDVSAQAALVAELQRRATTDPLTGLVNRRVLTERGNELISLARRYKHPLVFLMLDIDHFKKVNDTHGHDVGDKVLVALAGLLSKMARKTDIVARFGGEEFAIVLPETTLEGATLLTERMRQRVAGEDGSDFASPVPITVSIGVSTLQPDDDLDAMIKRADLALYRAKESGRNRVAAETLPMSTGHGPTATSAAAD